MGLTAVNLFHGLLLASKKRGYKGENNDKPFDAPSGTYAMSSNNLLTTGEKPYLAWTPDLAIGHTLLDADHQHIFRIANRLQNEILEQPDVECSVVGEVLVELIEHTGAHFAREESVMRAARFPCYREHKAQHDALMKKVDALHRQYMDGEIDIPGKVSHFLLQQLVPHILTTDMDVGRWLRAQQG